jgi:hypothetical protein
VNTKTVAKKNSAATSASFSLIVAASFQAALPQSLQLPNQIQAFAIPLMQPEVVPPEPIASLPSNLTDNALANSPGSIAAGISGLSTISAQSGINTSASPVPLVPALPISSLSAQASSLQLFPAISVADQLVSQTTNSAAVPLLSLSTKEPQQEITPSSLPAQSLDQPSPAASLLPQVGLNEISSGPPASLADTGRDSVAFSPPPTHDDSNAAKSLAVKATDPQFALNSAAALAGSTTLPTQNQPETSSTAPNRKQNTDTRLAPPPPISPALPVIDKPATDQTSALQAAMQTIASAFSTVKDGAEDPQVSASASSAVSSAAVLVMGVQSNFAAPMAGVVNISGETNTASDRQSGNNPVPPVTASRSTGLTPPSTALSGADLSPQKNLEMTSQAAIVPSTVQQPGSTVAAASSAVQVAVGATANSGLPHKSDATVLPPSSEARPAVRPPLEPPAPLPPGPVQMAQLVNRAGQSEMHIGLNTSAFGSVEVHTVVHANEVGVSIGSEKGDLRSLLSNELPGIANTLQQQNLRLNHVNFQQGSTLSNSPGGNSQQQRSFVRNAAPFVRPHNDAQGSGGSDFTERAAAGLNTGLSVLA